MQIRKDVVLEGVIAKSCSVLIDTGAEVTLIPKTLADEIGVNYTGEQEKLSGAFDGSSDKADYAFVTIRFPFFNNLSYLTKVTVSAKAIDILIGMDVLNPLKITIDTRTGELCIKNEVLEIAKTGLMLVGVGTITYYILKKIFGKKN